MADMTKQERERYLAGLLREQSMVANGAVERKEERLAAIAAELERIGHAAAPPVRRAETREEKAPDARPSSKSDR